MNILFVVPYVPTLIRARSYNLIRGLAARGHRIAVATLVTSDADRVDAARLRGPAIDVHAVPLPAWRSFLSCVRALVSTQPLQAVYSWSPELASLVRSLCAHADLVHVEHLRGARYGLACDPRAAGAAPVVWDSVDCISYLFEQSLPERSDRVGRLINWLELPRTRRFEGELARHFRRVLISSEADRRALAALAREAMPRGRRHPAELAEIEVIPNGVDTRYFTPSDRPRDERTIVFSGKMSYHANVTAAEFLISAIMPLVWARQPDVRLRIVGKEPSRRLVAMAARSRGAVEVTGTVPDIRPFLHTATLSAIPLVYGAGSQFKVLEAMACATPVVATPKAVSALAVQDGREAVVAADAPAFADAIIGLLDNPGRRTAIGSAGRTYVERHHGWDSIAASLERVYADAIEAHLPAPLKTGTFSHV